MEKHKKLIGILAGGIVLVLILGTGIFYVMSNKEKPEDTLQAFITKLNEQDYQSAYGYLSEKSKSTYDENTFVKRNANIYSGIGASNITIEIIDSKENTEGDMVVSYKQGMDTLAGTITFENEAEIIDEEGFKIVWNSTIIHPELEDIDHIQITSEEGKRGTIYDRTGKVLAEDGTAMQVGVVPGQLGEQKEATLQALAKKLDIEVSAIETAMSAAWVEDDLFVPVKTVANDDTLKSELATMTGIQVNKTSARVYPYAQKAAHLTGYIHPISAEELEANKDKGYSEADWIGETGLEAIYEDTLRAQTGYKIIITDVGGSLKSTIAEQKVADGTDLHTTIDIDLQVAGYHKILAHQDSGVFTAMNPKTGEVLALVSAPAYDPNDFALGMSDATWKALNEDAQKPLMNRFVSAYTPGSTFKAITAGIGLDTHTMRADEDFGKVKDWKWQADESWGDYYVTTMKEYDEPSNLKNALINSDNIYFAQLATKIGAESLAEKLTALGFGNTIDFDFALTTSTFGEDGKIANGSALADTGFGQGKLQINPLHLTALYSAFGNEGNVMHPYLNSEDEKKQTIWLEHAFSKENTSIIMSDLEAVMTNYNVTKAGLLIGGKTGTAEVGEEQLGWVSILSPNGDTPVSMVLMIENTKELGGSTYTLNLMRELVNSL